MPSHRASPHLPSLLPPLVLIVISVYMALSTLPPSTSASKAKAGGDLWSSPVPHSVLFSMPVLLIASITAFLPSLLIYVSRRCLRLLYRPRARSNSSIFVDPESPPTSPPPFNFGVDKDEYTRGWRMHFGIADLLSTKQPNFSLYKSCYPTIFFSSSDSDFVVNLELLGEISVAKLAQANATVPDMLTHQLFCTEYLHVDVLPCSSKPLASIYDVQSISLSSLTSPLILSYIKSMTSILDTHYPSTSSKIVLINASWSFRMVWRIIENFIPADRVDKIVIVYRDQPDEQLRVLVDLFGSIDLVPSRYGGGLGDTSVQDLFVLSPCEAGLWERVRLNNDAAGWAHVPLVLVTGPDYDEDEGKMVEDSSGGTDRRVLEGALRRAGETTFNTSETTTLLSPTKLFSPIRSMYGSLSPQQAYLGGENTFVYTPDGWIDAEVEKGQNTFADEQEERLYHAVRASYGDEQSIAFLSISRTDSYINRRRLERSRAGSIVTTLLRVADVASFLLALELPFLVLCGRESAPQAIDFRQDYLVVLSSAAVLNVLRNFFLPPFRPHTAVSRIATVIAIAFTSSMYFLPEWFENCGEVIDSPCVVRSVVFLQIAVVNAIIRFTESLRLKSKKLTLNLFSDMTGVLITVAVLAAGMSVKNCYAGAAILYICILSLRLSGVK